MIVLVATCEGCPLARWTETSDRCGHPRTAGRELDLDQERQEWCPLDAGPVTIRLRGDDP